MKRPGWFNLAVGISLVMLTILAWGFCSRVGAMVRDNAPNALPPILRETSVVLEEGRCRLWIETWNFPPPSPIPAGRTILRVGSPLDFRFPKPDRALGGFDAHYIRPPITKTSTVLIIACPIWLLAAPFCIFPLLWARRWREQRKRLNEELVGFPVQPADAAYRPQKETFRYA